MTTAEIWLLPVEARLPAFVARWEELAEKIGNRTLAEGDEMAEIADAIMERLLAAARLAYRHLDKYGMIANGGDELLASQDAVFAALRPFCPVEGL
jgi:hypothetical protein